MGGEGGSAPIAVCADHSEQFNDRTEIRQLSMHLRKGLSERKSELQRNNRDSNFSPLVPLRKQHKLGDDDNDQHDGKKEKQAA